MLVDEDMEVLVDAHELRVTRRSRASFRVQQASDSKYKELGTYS